MEEELLDFEFDLPPPTPLGPEVDEDLIWPPCSPGPSTSFPLTPLSEDRSSPISPVLDTPASPVLDRPASPVLFKPISPIPSPPKKKLKSVIVTDVPTRTWNRVPMVGAKDARRRLSDQKKHHTTVKNPRAITPPVKNPRAITPPVKNSCVSRPPVKNSCAITPPVKNSCVSRPNDCAPSTSQTPPVFLKPRPSFAKRNYGRKVHMHEKCLGVLSIQENGYSLTNGVKTVSYDGRVDPQRLFSDIIFFKVGHLLTVDEETHKAWKSMVFQLDSMHQMRQLKELRLVAKKPIGKCIFCDKLCHRFKVVTGGFCQISHIPLDVVPH